MNPAMIIEILQALLAAEPAIVTAIRNLLNGSGTADDLAVLGADKIAWQAIADKAQAEIDKTTKKPIV